MTDINVNVALQAELPDDTLINLKADEDGALACIAALKVAGMEVSGNNPLPVASILSDENGVPYTGLYPMPVDIGGNIVIDNLTVGFESVESILNVTQTPLLADQTFVGQFEQVLGYAAIVASIRTDAASAQGGAIIQFSNDGVNVSTTRFTSVPANFPGAFVAPIEGKYFRIIYVNGPVAQTLLEAMVYYCFNPPAIPQGAIGGELHDGHMAATVKGAMQARHPSGLYFPVKWHTNGGMGVTDAAEDASLLRAPFTLTAAGAAQVVVPATGTGLLRLRRISPTYAIRSPVLEPILSLKVGAKEAQRGNALTGRFDIMADSPADSITVDVDVLDVGGRVTGTVYYEVMS